MIDLALNNDLFIKNVLDAAIQELDILFSTEIGEVIGDVYYGVNWEQFLYVLTPMEEEVKKYIELQLQHTYYVKQLKYELEVQHEMGDVASTYLVKITLTDMKSLNDLDNKRVKLYKIN